MAAEYRDKRKFITTVQGKYLSFCRGGSSCSRKVHETTFVPLPDAARRPAATRLPTRRPAAAARPPPGQPRAPATMDSTSTTPASATRPTSARGAAPIRKTNRPAAGPSSAAAAGSIPACRPPLYRNSRIRYGNVRFPYQKPNFFERFQK